MKNLIASRRLIMAHTARLKSILILCSLFCSLVFLFITFTVTASHASLITFETTPDGDTPIDNADFSGVYTDGLTSVTFGISTTGGLIIDDQAVYEKRGYDTTNAYVSNYASPNNYDYDADGTGGDWFLRAPGTGNTVSLGSRSFLIYYSGVLPTAASGTIWDIDASETNTVSAYGLGGNLLDSIVLIAINGGDSLPATFSFSGLSAGISTIKITGGGPLGFDNFNATNPAQPAPEPASMLLLGTGLIGLAGIGRKKLKR